MDRCNSPYNHCGSRYLLDLASDPERAKYAHRRSAVMLAILALAALEIASIPALAQTETPRPANEAGAEDANEEKESPWLLVPVFQSNPKLGLSLGGLAGYMHYFDEKSRVSLFGVMAQYTSTGSIVGAAFTRSSFDEDRQRLVAGAAYGYVKNDYKDYLGTGVPLQSNGELHSFITRYLYRVQGDWFVGAQGIFQNFHISGNTAFDDQMLDILGIKGYKSSGVGVNAYHDSRDNENMPTRGWLLNANNIAYREGLGSEQNFDVYRLDLRGFLPHGDGNVLAARSWNWWTVDAPSAGQAPVLLRGYKMGQYLGKYMSSIEVEERLRLGKKWTSTFFTGVACLYGDGKDCSESANLFPMGGVGLQYVLKQKEGIVLNLEYAVGKDSNYGVYLKMGYSF